MKKIILTSAIALTATLTGCVEVGPPLGNERDRRAYNSLEEVRKDNVYVEKRVYPVETVERVGYVDRNGTYRYYVRDDGYYDRYGNFRSYTYTPTTRVVREEVVVKRDKHDHDVDDDGLDDYNPHNGHDRWARRSN